MKRILVLITLLFIPSVYSQHWIWGEAFDAVDGFSANNMVVAAYYLGDEANNRTDIIGTSGQAGADNEYMIDATLIPGHTFSLGDTIYLKIVDNGSDYVSWNISVDTLNPGFDEAPNMTLNTSTKVHGILLEDDDTLVSDRIDLNVGTVQQVNCSGNVTDIDGIKDIRNVMAVIYDPSTSSADAADDPSNHYTNYSCNTTIGNSTSLLFECLFNVQFYANPDTWVCNVTVNDTYDRNRSNIDTAIVNELIGIDVGNDTIDFGALKIGYDTGTTDHQKQINNTGNIAIDLNLNVYGVEKNDSNAMNCTVGNISANNIRWSLLTGIDWSLKNQSVSNETGYTVYNFDLSKNSNKLTYWDLGIPVWPAGDIVSGTCSGTIIFTAIPDT